MPPQQRTLAAELGQGGAPGGLSTDPGDTNPDLRWPLNLEVYDRMRRGDAGIAGALRAVKAPILAAEWGISRAGVRPVVADFVERELGLARDATGRQRPRPGGVRFRDTLQLALLFLENGHMPFELVAELGPHEVPGLTGTAAHLRKLLPLMPRTLASIDVAPDGGLLGVSQYQVGTGAPGTIAVATGQPVKIPVWKLVMFCHRREGGDWTGQSVLRAAYKHWFLKDMALRADGVAVDRTAGGLPVVSYPEDKPDQKREAQQLASSIRTGDDTGVAMPNNWSLSILGVEGRTADALATARYHGQEAAKATLAMFLELGHDGGLGSGNLSDTLLDVFITAVNEVAREVADVFTDYVVRKLVQWNFGPDEPWPQVTFSTVTRNDTTALDAIVRLAAGGLLGPVDAELVAAIRRRVDLPALVEGTVLPAGPPQAQPLVPGGVQPTTPTPAPLADPLYGQGGLRRPAEAVPVMPARPGVVPVVAAGAMPVAGEAGALSDLAARMSLVMDQLTALAGGGAT